ncbi:MAG: DNA mismatch repair endonuclease MutL [Bacilli bacterium]|nr:DNA mismatch repair endonuclease MutL [Bacilli bacterium]
MNKINILDAALADKIAAGEVVERPSSVVKELVENSIDAKASKIDIFVIDGGRTLIEVKDNGVGMSKEDAVISIKRHATSKIRFDQDLFAIKTMGFRGEALSAISSVSKFTLSTNNDSLSSGTKLYCLNSEVISIENCALPQGTDIKVEELFYNTPARLKYLKSDTSELSYVTDIVYKLALANPHISFSLTSNNKTIFKTSGKNDVIEIIAAIYGINVAKNMLKFEAKTNDFHIYGYTSNISISKSNRYGIQSYTNNRFVRNKILSDCIIDGYHEFLFENRYPYTVLYIQTDATLLDVNVHPTKQEIRISKENELKQLIKETIATTLKYNNQIINQTIKKVVNEDKPVQTFFDYADVLKEDEESYSNETHIQQALKLEEKETINKDYEVIGQIHGTYIIAQSKDGFILIDQHAAQERVRYEKYQKLFSKPSSIIDLLIPLVIELPMNEFQVVCDNLDLLNKLHINAEPFGNNTIKITQIPYYFERVDLKVYVDDVINQIVTNKKIDEKLLTDYAVATAACKASLKANTYLTTTDMQQIIFDLFNCEDPYTCPHGRPTMVKYSKYELERFFKRS